MNYKLNSEQDWQELARQANWSVIKLSTLCGVSTRTLERHFQETYQKTPEHWLTELRWQLAMELLLKGDTPKFVALEIGYNHPSNFSRQFKKRFGSSPAAFLSSHSVKSNSNLHVAKG